MCADYDASVVVGASVGVGVETVAVVERDVVVLCYVVCYMWSVVDGPVVEAMTQLACCYCVDDGSCSLYQ